MPNDLPEHSNINEEFLFHALTRAHFNAQQAGLRQRGLPAHAPDYEEVYDLLENRVLVEGTLPPAKKSEDASMRSSTAYPELLDIGNKVLAAIKANRQGANKNLRAMTDQLKTLLEQWEK